MTLREYEKKVKIMEDVYHRLTIKEFEIVRKLVADNLDVFIVYADEYTLTTYSGKIVECIDINCGDIRILRLDNKQGCSVDNDYVISIGYIESDMTYHEI